MAKNSNRYTGSKTFNLNDYRALQKEIHKANQRITRIESRYGEDAWAVHDLYGKLNMAQKAITPFGQIRITKDMSQAQLNLVRRSVKDFLYKSKTSTLTGIRQAKANMISGLQKSLSSTQDVDLSDREIQALYKLVEDTYFTNSKIDAWELKYSIDNDRTRFLWADPTNGKGVIYYLKDEYGNECPYDFKNILFNGYYTFSYTINDTIKENYPNIYIYKIEGNFAKVIVCVPLDDEISDKTGWIEIKYLGTNLNNYSDITPIMSEPDEKSTVVFEIKDANWGDLYHVLDAHNKWLKIQNIYNPEEVGWLAPKYQCNDPYTTCN